MNLTELKHKRAAELVELAHSLGIENMARSRKQDVIFSLLKAHAKKGEDIWGDGVLEILQELLAFEIDYEALEDRADEMEDVARKIQEMEQGSPNASDEDLRYIG